MPNFLYAGEVYTRVGISSNGYLVVGGGTGPDNTFVNQNLPSPNRPNNVLAPFWTDLNPGVAGALRLGVLTDGVSSWLVADWAGVAGILAAATGLVPGLDWAERRPRTFRSPTAPSRVTVTAAP